jgi:hypothetical protein
MIQRIQTVYLFIATLTTGGAFFVEEVWTGPAASTQTWFIPTSMGLLGLVAVGSFLSIFLYKDRQRQRTFVLAVQALVLLAVGALFAGQFLAGTLPDAHAYGSSVGEWVVVVLPLATYTLLYMARRKIDADIRLVKSMDRLR